MSSALHLRRKPRGSHHSAKSVWVSGIVAFCRVASQLRSFLAATFSGITLSRSAGVASFRAPFRSSPRRKVRVVLPIADRHGVVVRPESSGLHPSHLSWSDRLPNNSLVPTPVTNALSLRVGSGAAHLKRWAS